MDLASAPNTDAAASLPGDERKFKSRLRLLGRQIDAFLEAERQQLPLWAVVSFGSGIAAWFALPDRSSWIGFILLSACLASTGLVIGARVGRAMLWWGTLMAMGCAWIWLRATWVEAPRIHRISIESFEARVEKVEPLVAREKVRLTVAPIDGALPPRLRINIGEARAPEGLGPGAIIRIRARLMPPPPKGLPGGYDFARKAWFEGVGGVGTALGELVIVRPSNTTSLNQIRADLGKRVRAALPGGGDGVATALVSGDQNAIPLGDAEAMRRSGLAHLLSVSGIHIAAVVGAAMLLALKLLALSPKLARRHNLILWSAAVGAIAGIAYTILTGLQVPTVRSCIAALLVLLGIALGREAISLRLVAVGALLILIIRPESLIGASFQLSFAAVTSIIALHGLPKVRALLHPRDEGIVMRFGRSILGLILTGLIVEITLMPIGLYHFHKAGLYGVAANLIAIPLTTFVVMPALAAGLTFDLIGLGAPFWWVAGQALDGLNLLAHGVADAKGAVAMVPAMPTWAYAACLAGGCWAFLWSGRIRWLGLIPWLIGLFATALAPRPDLLVTGDGRHLAVITNEGTPMLLRGRAGDFTRDMLAESAGYDGEGADLETSRFASCSAEACVAAIDREGRRWLLLATRSRDFTRWDELVAACAAVDIAISDRKLPDACTPKWLKLDRPTLAKSGGLAVHLGDDPTIRSVRGEAGAHPWSN